MKKLLLLTAFLFFTFVEAQVQESPRKKIGLVLSGGGAKGFAHIGVLKVLEEAGVKVDYIGGTSMGAVIGGLYASGYSAMQIDSIFRSTNFDELLQDYIPRTSKTYFERRADEQYALTLPFNKFRVGIPTALSKGMYNYNLLSRLTANVRHVRKFSDLPIPFLCVATNIETGEQVLLKDGSLPLAMLASSSFPSLFAPVELDGKLLIDGGVVNNYPIQEVREMGADIIIGVDVQDGLKDRKSLRDATRILVQISNMGMLERMKEKTQKTDVYIKPNVSDFTVISFDEGAAIIRAGEEASFAVYEKLKALGDSLSAPKSPAATFGNKIKIGKIKIGKLKNYTRAYVLGKLNIKPDTDITFDVLKEGINNLNATQNFSGIAYEFEENDGRDDLVLQLTENPNRTFLKIGAHYDGLFKSAVLLNVTHKKTLFKNDVLSTDAIIGDRLRYNLDYYIDNGFYWSYGFKSRFNSFNRNAKTDFNNGRILDLLGINSINIDVENWQNQFYVQTLFADRLLLGGGLEHQNIRIKSETLENTTRFIEQSNYYSLFGYVKLDSFDNKYYPKSGWLVTGDIQHLFYSTNYTQEFEPFSIAKGSVGFATKFFPRTTLKLESDAGFAIGERSINFFDFTFGGFGFTDIVNIKPFYGYNFLSLSADSYIRSTVTFDYEFYRKHHVNLIANYMNIGDNLFQTPDWITRPRISGYALGYGLETIIGPAEIKYSWSPETGSRFTWFSIGFVF